MTASPLRRLCERLSTPLPRPRAISTLCAVALVVVLLACRIASADGLPHAAPESVVSMGMTVSDMDRALAFYTEVLAFENVSDTEVAGDAWERLQGVFGLRMRICTLRLGAETIELTQYLAPEGRPIPSDWRSNDRWFQHIAIIVSDMEKAYAHLRAHNVRHASTGPQRLPDWNLSAGGIEAFYFKDPDGHVLEILDFPPGKGAAKWHANSDRLFLGIDHTAIVVADTDASLRFYRDALGMEIAGTSENYGTEQEHLNNVFGARLRITSLRLHDEHAGPAIELLEYLAPRDGRPAPADTRANDLWHWQVNILAPEAEAMLPGLRAAGSSLVSPGLVELPDEGGGRNRGVMLRDPDGHAIRLFAPSSRMAANRP